MIGLPSCLPACLPWCCAFRGASAEPNTTPGNIIRFVFSTRDLYVATARTFTQSPATTVTASASTAASTSTWPSYNPAIDQVTFNDDTASAASAETGEIVQLMDGAAAVSQQANATGGRRLLEDALVPAFPE
jgi:hypothetical protein